MYLSRTPLRVSLLGGGTDFPSYYNDHGGRCLSASIDKYVYVMVKERHDRTIRVSYTQTENVTSPDELQHDLIREALKLLGVTQGVEIITLADVPGHGSGLASSSAVTVGALHALAHYAGVVQDWQTEPGRLSFELQRLAAQIEVDILQKTPGRQDQIAVAYGGLNLISFERDEITVRSLLYDFGCPVGRWQDKLKLFAIAGARRDSQRLLQRQAQRNGANLVALGTLKALAERAMDCLIRRRFDELGPLLNESWRLKRTLADRITNPVIDEMYEAGLAAGATGGKVCGAGGGGYLLLYCPGETYPAVAEAMRPYGPELPFRFEMEGSVCKQLY